MEAAEDRLSRSGGGPPEPGRLHLASLAEVVPAPDLRRALERVLLRWRDESGTDEVDREAELTDHLVSVAEAIVCAALGEPDPAVSDDGVVLRRRLLQLLRAELTQVWSLEPELRPDADEITRTLQALDHVEGLLAPRWDEQFGVELAGPSGLELAVEVAHDFRSPLSSVLFLADTLRQEGSGELNELQKRQLSLIYAAALSMVSMAGDVVDLGRGGQAIADREPTQFSITEVMDSVREMVEPMVEAKGLSLIVRPPEGDIRLGYSEGLRRTLLNLTTNAVKFTSEGFVELSARGRGPSRVLFSVRDTGPGIRPSARGDLYQAFRPFHGRSGFHFSGTGLGLTIARKLVHSMEGELRYETQRNLGTRFYFTIPLAPVETL